MQKKVFSQRQAKEMYQLLSEIHCGIKDKNPNMKTISFIELCWMFSIEKHLPEQKQLIRNHFKKSKNLFSLKK